MTGISEPSLCTRPRYQVLLDNRPDAVIVLDGQNRILEWSHEAQHLFGWTADEVQGKTLADTVLQSPDSSQPHGPLPTAAEPSSVEEGGIRIAMHARHKEGRAIPVSLSLLPLSEQNNNGKKTGDESRALMRALAQMNMTQRLIDAMADAIVVSDKQGRVLLVNSAARLLFGLDMPSTQHDLSIHELILLQEDGITSISPDKHPLYSALDGLPVYQRVAVVRSPYRAMPIDVSINATPVFDPDNPNAGMVAVFHDISEYKRHERALAQQICALQEQAELPDLMRDALMVRSLPDNVIRYWSRGAERLYKFRSDEAVGCMSHELLATQFPMPMAQLLELARQQGYWEGEVINTAADGTQRVVLSQWIVEARDSLAVRIVETNADITQRVHGEQALRQSLQHYALLVESTTEYAIMLLSADGRIESWNRGAEIILGYNRNEAQGQHVDLLFTTEDRLHYMSLRELEKARREKRADDDRWHVRRDGSKFWATGVTMPIFHPDGSVRGFVKIMRDKTQQRLADEQTHFLANHDALTGLYNRVRFADELHHTIALCERNRAGFALFLMDLDRFKLANDTFGHHIGDLLLKEVSLRIRATLRETDFVARLGGDEFVLIQRECTQPQAAELASRESRVRALRRALQEGQFELYYQPQIDLRSWKVSAVEALLRWHASELDMLPPRDFLGEAEESGIIIEIGVWALRQACLQIRQWQQKGLSDLRVSVNCSARQFNDPEFMAMVPRVLRETGLAASSLELEIQEALLAQRSEIKEQLSALRMLGIRITVDNFGTGNTALRDLQGLEVDALKIDKAFVCHLPHRREDSAITSAIISLAHSLGIGVVAGGVETAEQLAYLQSRECQSAQGFIFSPPVTADEFEGLLMSGNWSRFNRAPGMEDPEGVYRLH